MRFSREVPSVYYTGILHGQPPWTTQPIPQHYFFVKSLDRPEPGGRDALNRRTQSTHTHSHTHTRTKGVYVGARVCVRGCRLFLPLRCFAAPPVFLIQTSCTFFFLHARTFTKRTRTSESIHTIVLHTYCILVFFEGVNDDTCVLLLLLLLVL